MEVAQGRRKLMLLSLVREYILYVTSGTQIVSGGRTEEGDEGGMYTGEPIIFFHSRDHGLTDIPYFS